MKISQILIGGVVAAMAVITWSVSSYNQLISRGQQVDGQWAQVETQYQRRFDLIPNLVEATKGTLEQEREVFGQIAQARQGYAGAQTQSDKVVAANQMETALSRLLVIMENYPQLQSNQTILSLMDELAGTENRVSVERQRYNDAARNYNTQIKSFPTMVLASWFRFGDKPYFSASVGATTPPKVDLQLGK